MEYLFSIFFVLLVLAIVSILLPGQPREEYTPFKDEDEDQDSTDELSISADVDESNSLVGRYLTASTSVGRKTWMDYIGYAIYHNTGDSSRTTDVYGWMTELVDEVCGEVRQRIDLTKADENIAVARTMAVILALWTARILRAKAYDVRRTLEDRKQLLEKLREFSTMLNECLIDESMDPVYFSAQDWRSPYDPAESLIHDVEEH